MWEDTNYAAQVEQLKKAGLSVGLMYGKGGAGGATTGAGATGVSAPTAPTGMGLQGGSQLAAQVANIELTTNGRKLRIEYNSAEKTSKQAT